ncbi:50S ribosomal protein L24 [Thermus oshimai]|jgi:large subunit ribosomal protein L24|uniref:Large ribosomal subunit protein uL24 n=1 Tax=Thermus oshimai JL-2 TaxID=751945 RepID=K7R3A6_THEOS|nr:50S ribosomal protein L24 [Thermus oshimai]AFV75364.1 ribosomal protein L24, bacterial/organelle [Thermus oshimai JL-2]
MQPKLHVKKGDTVLVASGKYKGRTGKVKQVLPKKYAVIVEGVNIVKKAVRPSPKHPQGGFVEQEAPLHASKVRPICPSCGKPTRVRKKVLEDGRKVRACAKCGGVLDVEE